MTYLMTIVTNEGVNLKRLVLNKGLQELLMKQKKNKSIITRCSQPSGNFIKENFSRLS